MQKLKLFYHCVDPYSSAIVFFLMVFSGRRLGNTGARWLCVYGSRAIKPRFMVPFQGEENDTLRSKTTAATPSRSPRPFFR